jgi:SPP1 gp7 family putative phage head morphogenesis protein
MAAPSSLYRNAIDLNRYSNSVAKQIVLTYNDIIIDSVNQLRIIDELSAPAKAARLRAILAQLKESLATWSGSSITSLTGDLQGLAELQSEFVVDQLRRVLPAGARNAVSTVEIGPQFAQSVVTTDPTRINVVTLSDDLTAAIQGAPQTYALTASKGAAITLPNGQVVQKAFRGIVESQAEMFSQVVRNGLLTGESSQSIARRLVGRLQLGESGSVRQMAEKGGELTTATNRQVMTLVRTSVNQVANAASQQVYEANQDITERYQYVATLDARTSSICAALDGRTFEYGKGPTPPQHFNCRSTTVPVIDYERLGFDPPPEGTRASMDGRVPADMSYGQWLQKQSQQTKRDVLGKEKVGYFELLAEKYGPRDAMAKLVRDDGSELTLEQLRKRYGAIKEG